MKKLFVKIKSALLGKFNLKFLIIVAIAVMLMTAAAVFFLIRAGSGDGKDEPPTVDYSSYAVGREQIKSISDVLGMEREWTSMEFTVDGTTEISKYVYTGLTSGSADVETYAEYLKDECGFIPLMKFDPSNPAGYLSYGKKSIDEGYMLKVDIDYTNEDYTIYTNKSESTDIPATDPNEEDGTSRNDLLGYLSSYDFSILGLPKELSGYVTIFDVGRTVINNTHCYGINVYEKSVDGKSNLIVGKFYVPLSQDSVYKYDIKTNEYTQIKKIYKEPVPPVEAEVTEEPEEVDTSNMTKEELKEKEKADKAAEKEAAKKAKELEKANKEAQKEQEKKLKASEKATKEAEKEAAKAEKAAQKAKEAQEKAEIEQQKANEGATTVNPN